MKIKYSRCTVC